MPPRDRRRAIPTVAPPPARPWLEEVGRDPGPLRIAVTRSAPNGAVVHPDCVAAVDEAARLAAALGHHVAEAAPILDGQMLTEAFFTLWSAGCAWTVADWARRTGQTPDPARFEPLTWALHQMGERRSAGGLSHRGPGPPARLPGGRPLLRRLGRLAHPDPGRAAPAAGQLRSHPGRPRPRFATVGRLRAVHPAAQRDGQPAMSTPLAWNAAGPAHRHPLGRPLR